MPQWAVLPQHFSKAGLLIEPATLHCLYSLQAFLFLSVEEWKDGIFLLQDSVESINHIACWQSWAIGVTGGETEGFSPWNTHLMYGGSACVLLWKSFFFSYILEEVLSLETARAAGSCRTGKDAISLASRVSDYFFSTAQIYSYQKRIRIASVNKITQK